MDRKIKRGGNEMFGHGRHTGWIKILVWVLAIGVLFYGGYYVGTSLLGKQADKETSSGAVSSTQTSAATDPSAPTSEPVSTVTAARTQALFCDGETLTDSTKRAAFLQEAKAKGANAVVFDLKDATGKVYVQSDNEIAKKVKAIVADAPTLSALYAEFQSAGLTGIPEIYTFLDPLSSGSDPSLAIWYTGTKNYLWLDNYANKGGKAWLNPYNTAAQDYILALSGEAYQAGFKTVLFNGNLFGASASTKSAYYSDSTDSHLTVMTAFVKRCEEQAEQKGAICYFAADAEALLTGSGNLGSSFLDTGASHIAPVFALSDMSANLTVGSEKIAKPADDPAKTTQLLLTAYQEKAKETVFLPFFTDYASLEAAQIAALDEKTGYVQSAANAS